MELRSKKQLSSEFSDSLSSENSPKITAIMPVRNEERYIEQSLNSLIAQDYPSNKMEIIVADGMSTDKTRDIVERIIHTARNYDVK